MGFQYAPQHQNQNHLLQHVTTDASAPRMAPTPAPRRHAEVRDAMFPARGSEPQLIDRHHPRQEQHQLEQHRLFLPHQLQPQPPFGSFAHTPAPFDYTVHARGDDNSHTPTSEHAHHSAVYPLSHDAGPWGPMGSYAAASTPAPAPIHPQAEASGMGAASSAHPHSHLYPLPQYQQHQQHQEQRCQQHQQQRYQQQHHQQEFRPLAGPSSSTSVFATAGEDDSNDAKLLREVLQGPPRQHQHQPQHQPQHQFAYPHGEEQPYSLHHQQPQQSQSYHDPPQSSFTSAMNNIYSTTMQPPLASISSSSASVSALSSAATPYDKMGIYMSPDALAQIRSASLSMSSSMAVAAMTTPGGVSPAGSSASAASGSAAGSDTGVGINIGIGMTLGGIGLSSDMGMMTLTPLGSNSASTPPATTKKKPASRICRVPGCMKGIRSRGLCKGHGGGRRCTTPGCEISDQGGGHCIAHGGGKRCHVAGCVKSAQSKGLCKLHGGARRCKVAECSKNCQVKGLCRLHYGMTASASMSMSVASPHPGDENNDTHTISAVRAPQVFTPQDPESLQSAMSFNFL